MKQLFTFFLCLLFTAPALAAGFIKDGIKSEKPDADGRKTIIEIVVTGYGADMRLAEQDALNEALKKVNGTKMGVNTKSSTVDSKSGSKYDTSHSGSVKTEDKMKVAGAAVSYDTKSDNAEAAVVGVVVKKKQESNVQKKSSGRIDESSYGKRVERNISESAGGVIKTYETVASIKMQDGKFKTQLKVFIYKNIAKVSDNRMRIAVIPFRVRDVSSSMFSVAFTERLSSLLSKSNKMAVLDRRYSAELENEHDSMQASDMSASELASIGTALAADYIIAGTIENYSGNVNERKLMTTNKSLFTNDQKAIVSFKLIETGTGVTKFADSVSLAISGKGVDIDPEQLVTPLSKEAGIKILESLFPFNVETIEGDVIFIGMGDGIITTGDTYKVYKLGNDIKDSVTGSKIGTVETETATVEITETLPGISKAKILSGLVQNTQNAKYVVRYYKAPSPTENVTTEKTKKKEKRVTINENDW